MPSPLLIPFNNNKTIYRGYLNVQQQSLEFYIEVHLRTPGVLQGASLSCSWKMKHLLADCLNTVNRRLQESNSLAEFAIELQNILETQVGKQSPSKLVCQPPEYYSRLLNEIEIVGWDRLIYIDSDFKELHLMVKDDRGREHILKILISPQYPKVSPEFKADLPLQFEVHWKTSTSLNDVVEQFTAELSSHQDLWIMLDEIDSNAWVIDPENPSPSCSTRRLVLGNNASLQVLLDPKHPRALPECIFMGAEYVVGKFRDSFRSGAEKWNPSDTVLENLQKLVGVKLPSPATTNKEDFTVECGICYAYKLGKAIPDTACEDTRCGQPYHQMCLYEPITAKMQGL
ncbi:PREDICTED: E3 ubiquitin-protein ligase FANCL-like isoform X3 [Priapulus caudatus]|uniref:E3 ubiquitin-protein ligase FANCL-like isoform X3 n=1 Tax=Priapulus caudatus TaxID=37621 RepID=A0ABM1DXV9_PRICU|nr:PREDICTED: E3 ubiquitin-protein ligase FANCL-like isoform X3 [Priapulus caudatus]